jgi:hypothetical protein
MKCIERARAEPSSVGLTNGLATEKIRGASSALLLPGPSRPDVAGCACPRRVAPTFLRLSR